MLLILQIKSHKDIVHFETAYVVKLHRVARLATPQPVSLFFVKHFDVFYIHTCTYVSACVYVRTYIHLE